MKIVGLMGLFSSLLKVKPSLIYIVLNTHLYLALQILEVEPV